MTSSAPGRRRSLLIALPVAGLVVLAGAWSAFWYHAVQTAEQTITAWIEREARAGRVYRCGTRTIGGYPFRIEVRCTDPVAELRFSNPPFILRGGELLGVAQVYQPAHVIAEITGPVSVMEGERLLGLARWRLAQASLRGRPRMPERLSIAIDGLSLDRPGGANGETVAAAQHAELHARLDPASSRDNPVFDFAARISGATLPAGGERLTFDAELIALVHGLKDLSPEPVSTRLKKWQEAGGRLELESLRVRQGQAVAVAKGSLGLSAAGRLDGTLTVTMAGFEEILQALVAAATGIRLQGGALAGLSLLGRPAELEGRRAVSVPLQFKDGAVTLGRIPLGRVGPLY